MEIGIGGGSARRTRALPRGMGVLGRALLAFALIVAALPLLSLTPGVSAASLVVNTTADTLDGTCDADCSLRDAVAVANGTPETDTITFALPGAAPWTITLAVPGGFALAEDVTIQGPGAASLTIDDPFALCGPGTFTINPGVVATIAGLTASGNAGVGFCGSAGINNSGGTLTVDEAVVQGYVVGLGNSSGVLTVTDSVVQNNAARGIVNQSFGTLVVRNSSVLANGQGAASPFFIGFGGGGVMSQGVLQITDSSIAGNTGGPGAGVFLYQGGSATIAGSTIAGNAATSGSGGGIYAQLATLTMINSTVSGNTSVGTGGGIHADLLGATSLRFVTVAGNTAGVDGGGIFASSATSLLGSIVAGNVDSDPGQATADCYGSAFTSQGSNVLGTGSDCAVGADDVAFAGALADLLNPTLADNGGPTPTHALVANSPALGSAAAAAGAGAAAGRDQRGVARPQGLGCDSGAFESDLPPACASPFADVAQTDAACVAIVALADRGIIKGYGNGDFGPDDAVQRAQMAAFVVRAFQWQGLPTGPRAFTDFGPLVGELREASLILANLCADQADDATCVARGYGDGRFGPTDQVTHAQVISFLARAFVQNPASGWQAQPAAPLPYAGVPGVHATDIRAFTFYAGAIPDAPDTADEWNSPASRAWVASVLYQALQSVP